MVSSIAIKYKQFYSILIICLQIVKWFEVSLSITDCSIQYQSVANTQLNGFKYSFQTLMTIFLLNNNVSI